jgi:hypothetical protein
MDVISHVVAAISRGEAIKANGPIEHWLTTLATGFWGFDDSKEGLWSGLQKGDVLIFQAGPPNWDFVDKYRPKPKVSGFIGAGIVERVSKKVEPRWLSEVIESQVHGGATPKLWPNLVHFSNAVWFGNVDGIPAPAVQELIEGCKTKTLDMRVHIEHLAQNNLTFKAMTKEGFTCAPMGTGGRLIKNSQILARLFLSQAPAATYRVYSGSVGNLEDSRTWEKALAAVTQLGGTASRKQVADWILTRDPDYNTKNLADLYMMAVNSPGRTGYSQNEKPRRTDQNNRYDRLFKVGKGIFETYDPAQHGIWEIYSDASSGSRFGVSVRRVSNPVEEALAVAEDAAEQAAIFDPTDVADARKRVTADIIRRRGQPAFRKALMDAYDGACAITGCNLLAVLEAAHVHPYKGDHTNVVSNGLLLRADIHTLFDLGLIAIESETMVVRVSPKLKGTDYEKLDGSPLRHPKQNAHRVSPDALDWHWNLCGWCD